ncbi:MAG: ABC transporter permease [Ignavibacteriales bacterium]|nr:ABC transporter permease [Ignavibacteriales bacterium]
MTFKRIKPVVKKEFLQILRDKRSLSVLLVFPALLIMVVGFALNFDVKHIPMAVFDQDKSSRSREFIKNFSNTEYFDVKYYISGYDEVDELLNNDNARIAVVIPPDFSKGLSLGRDVSIQIIIDGSNANTATTAIGYMTVIVQTYSQKIVEQTFQRVGMKMFLPIDFRPKIWYNPELSSAKFLIPGLIGFILMISAVISTSLSVVREKERGTMEQMMVSSLHTVEIIIGKTLTYLFIALLASVFVLIVGFVLFDVAVRGSILWLYAGIFIFLLGGLGQGLLISTITHNQQVAFMMAVLSSLLPTFLLSGFVFPIRSMPVFLQIISNVTPAKFFLVVVRSVIVKGVGVTAFWDQLIYMIIFMIIMITISSVRLMKKTN